MKENETVKENVGQEAQEKKNVEQPTSNEPSQQQIDDWKSKFEDVFSVNFGEEKYIYRPIRRFEYKQVLQLDQNPENRSFAEEKIAKMCVLFPEIDPTEMSKLKAGTISTIVELIMYASNFGVMEEPVKL